MKRKISLTGLVFLICQLFLNVSIKASETDTIANLRDSLYILAQTAENETFQRHFESILEVVNSQTKYTSTDSSFLYALYYSLYNEEDSADLKNFDNYRKRERDILISWKSPTNGAVSLAWLRLPKNWNPEKSYPLYTYLHGADWFTAIKMQYLAFPMLDNPNGSTAYEDGYLLRPWGRGNTYYTGISETDVWESLAKTEELFKIDPQRRYLTGHSLGGYGSWYVGQRSTDYWAAMGVQAGSFSIMTTAYDYENVWRLQNTPVLFICGTSDPVRESLLIGYNRLIEIGNTRTEWLSFNGGHVVNEAEVQYLYSWFQGFSRPNAVIDNFNGKYALADSATIFGEGVVSVSGRNEFAPLLSADGNSIYFSSEDNTDSTLSTHIVRQEAGVWSAPQEVSFTADNSNSVEVYLNADNTVLYYTQRTGDNSKNYEYRFWKTEKDSVGNWGEPVEVDAMLNSQMDKRRINVVKNHNIYFSAGGDLYYSTYQPADGTYTSPQQFEYPVNTDSWEGDLYVQPQENYLLFSSSREDGQNKDIYISYKFKSNRWTNPKKLGSSVNTTDDEFSPYMSPDEKYLFFSRTIGEETNIYWMENHFTESLKNTNFIAYSKSDYEDIHAPIGVWMVNRLPDTVIFDDDGISTLRFSASMVNGQDLPNWLRMNSITLFGTPDAAGRYELEIAAVEAVGTKVTSRLTLYVDGTTEIISKAQDHPLSIYPNPTTGHITLSLGTSQNHESLVEIYNLQGAQVFSKSFQNTPSATIDLTGKPAGIYLVKVVADEICYKEKILKE